MVEEDESSQPEEVELGGVWRMAYHVGRMSDGKSTTPNKSGRITKNRMKFVHRNRFEGLREEAVDEPEEEETGRSEEAQVVERLAAAVDAKDVLCMMNSHVTDSTRILASVDKLNESGNDARFSKGQGGSYIRSRKNGSKAMLKRENGVFALEVMVLNGDVATPAKIIIDSGAAENVMPKDLMRGVKMREKRSGVRFMAADGKEMCNYGQKDISFIPMEFWAESGFVGQP